MKPRIRLGILVFLAAYCGLSLAAAPLPLVPQPQQVEALDGAPFTLNAETRIAYRGQEAEASARLLASALRPATGWSLPVEAGSRPMDNTIFLSLIAGGPDSGAEGYRLKTGHMGIVLLASRPAGLFYGTQTLLQLLPPAIFQTAPAADMHWEIPATLIKDRPQFPWRGMMLDVSRYFFTKDFVKRYLDLMAMHKLNRLHWHLVDDCGWRVEIKKYPRLTEIGAFRGKGEYAHGGFYSQDDLREIVAYAAERHIVIVPEIEIPAHTLCALAAYPYLGCTGKPFTVPDRHSISPEIYCAGKESTWTFLQEVMDEVCELFPGEFIHLGGDEAKYNRWKACPDCQARIKELGLQDERALQGWMTTRIEEMLARKGRRIIGWDEILACGVSDRAGIMTWHRPQTAAQGAKRGNPVVMSLTGHAYFDTAESKLPGEPPAATWLQPISLQKAYEWDPVPAGLEAAFVPNILGPSACIWTDQFLHKREILADKPGGGTAKSEAYVEYLSLPRMAALAEVGWTAPARRDFEDFSIRMSPMYTRYAQAGYNFRFPTPLLEMDAVQDGARRVSARSPITGGSVRYTLDGSNPTMESPELAEAIPVPKTAILKAATFSADGQHHSLVESYVDRSQKYARHGQLIGEWKPGQPGSGSPKTMIFDATGHINKNGPYIVTFLYTGGQHRLDIDGIEILMNDTLNVAEDIHHGMTGGRSQDNTYRIHIDRYETGASFKIKAAVYGDVGNDTRGVVLIRPGS